MLDIDYQSMNSNTLKSKEQKRKIKLPNKFKGMILLNMHAKYSKMQRKPKEVIDCWYNKIKLKGKI